MIPPFFPNRFIKGATYLVWEILLINGNQFEKIC
jgi:hypothetical protein